MARPKNTDERRAQIVQGLLTVMAKEGYARASVVAIARAAGLSPGLVHYHFGSKQEVLVGLVDELTGRFSRRLERRLEGVEAPLSRLDAWIDAALARGDDSEPDTVQAWVFVGAEAVRQPEVRELYREAVSSRLAYLSDAMRAALREQGRSTRRANKLAALVLSAVEGAYQLGSVARDVLPVGFAAPEVKRAARALIAAQPPC